MALVSAVATGALLLGPGAPAAPAGPAWAPASGASIHPGVRTVTGGNQCTSNFVFAAGSTVYLGQAAHCAGTGGGLAADGCTSDSLPLGTPVEVEGASAPGVLAYSSWLTMQAQGETDPEACGYNDLALVQLDPADARRVNPTVPHWGGPTALGAGGPTGSPVFSYGSSELRLGITLLSPKVGVTLDDGAGGWAHQVLTLTPGIPGDSGSGFLDARGRAVGVLSTLELLPLAGTNGVGDLRRELDYLHGHTPLDADLVPGTEPFDGAQLPIGP